MIIRGSLAKFGLILRALQQLRQLGSVGGLIRALRPTS
jgi:hypothetical protein